MKRLREKEPVISWSQWRWNRVRDISLVFLRWNNNNNTSIDIDVHNIDQIFLPKDVTDHVMLDLIIPLQFHLPLHLEHVAWTPDIDDRPRTTLSFYTRQYPLKPMHPTHYDFDFSGGYDALMSYIMTHYAFEEFSQEKGWKPDARYCTRRIGWVCDPLPKSEHGSQNLSDESAFIDMMERYDWACSVLDEYHPPKHMIHIQFSISTTVTRTEVRYCRFKGRLTS